MEDRERSEDVEGEGTEEMTVRMGEDASWGLAVDPSMDIYDWEAIHQLCPQ